MGTGPDHNGDGHQQSESNYRRWYPENIYPPEYNRYHWEGNYCGRAGHEHMTYSACDADMPCPTCDAVSSHSDSLIVAVDGACKGNGRQGAKASCGVFFGIDSVENRSWISQMTDPTNNKAELEACIYALRRVWHLLKGTSSDKGLIDLRELIIKADSEYVVKGISEWVPVWKQRSWTNSRGLQPSNMNYWVALERQVAEF